MTSAGPFQPKLFYDSMTRGNMLSRGPTWPLPSACSCPGFLQRGGSCLCLSVPSPVSPPRTFAPILQPGPNWAETGDLQPIRPSCVMKRQRRLVFEWNILLLFAGLWMSMAKLTFLEGFSAQIQMQGGPELHLCQSRKCAHIQALHTTRQA